MALNTSKIRYMTYIPALLGILFLGAMQIHAQELPVHLFLGNWKCKTENYIVYEEWKKSGNLISAKTGIIIDSTPKQLEQIKLSYEKDILQYRVTVFEQNDGKEICFSLKDYEKSNNQFTFENAEHDFPKRIIYQFHTYRKMIIRIEGDTSSFEYEFEKDLVFPNFVALEGTIRKIPFSNKAGKIIDGVFDYFFEVEGIKYFIKFNGSHVTKEFLEQNLDVKISVHVEFLFGLWDTDDPNVQSRVGIYVWIFK